jgi:hypothetical protein
MPKRFAIQQQPPPFPLERVRVFPLEQRRSLTTVEQILVKPESASPALGERAQTIVREAAERITTARERGASVMLIYGAHLLRNGAALVIERMLANGWVTHLATNGAGTIHDWEYAFLGRSTESVEENVESGTFGTWDETSRNIHWALYGGSLRQEGYGTALGRYIAEDGTEFPGREQLARMVQEFPDDPVSPALCDLLVAMRRGHLPEGPVQVEHRWKEASILASAWKHRVPLTVHPGIGYDIISNHPIFNGAVVGRAAAMDFRHFASAVEGLDGGVVLSIGSAIMGPQVFEKTLSCVNNLRIQQKRPIVQGHSIYVVDLQDGGNWDWAIGEPPKSNPAYYLRFCKSFSRMGGRMQYVQSDNMAFVHALYAQLNKE